MDAFWDVIVITITTQKASSFRPARLQRQDTRSPVATKAEHCMNGKHTLVHLNVLAAPWLLECWQSPRSSEHIVAIASQC